MLRGRPNRGASQILTIIEECPLTWCDVLILEAVFGLGRGSSIDDAQTRFISVGDSIQGWSFARSFRMIAAKILPCPAIVELRTR